MSTPPASLEYARHHRAYHTDDGEQSHYGEEPSEDDVGDDNPVERYPWRLKMSVKSFLCHIINLFAKVVKKSQSMNILPWDL